MHDVQVSIKRYVVTASSVPHYRQLTLPLLLSIRPELTKPTDHN
jgi:hypothetical protein